jgi:ketosteroid isomerase-like protein
LPRYFAFAIASKPYVAPALVIEFLEGAGTQTKRFYLGTTSFEPRRTMMPNPISPIQQPITGSENIDNLSRPIQALSQFYRAFNTRDLALAEANWDNSAEAAMDNPLGGIKRGWAEIRSTYERLFGGNATIHVEFWDYTLHEAGEVFWAVGRERGQYRPVKGEAIELAIRTSRLFRRDEAGRWRQMHHHGSIENPLLLQAYQKAVLG